MWRFQLMTVRSLNGAPCCAQKEKKHKKHKKEKKSKHKETAPQPKWGQYGIIKEADMFQKQEEFFAWLSEVSTRRQPRPRASPRASTSSLPLSSAARTKLRLVCTPCR